MLRCDGELEGRRNQVERNSEKDNSIEGIAFVLSKEDEGENVFQRGIEGASGELQAVETGGGSGVTR
jgi:hypothetical protein